MVFQLLGDSTEQMSASLGQTLAGLLNASFGNAVEIIVGVAALLQSEFGMSQISTWILTLRRRNSHCSNLCAYASFICSAPRLTVS